MSEIKVKKPRAKAKTKKSAPAPVLVPVIRITNPFNPREFVTGSVVWQPAKTLDAYFPLGASPMVVSVSGKLITQDKFGTTYLDRTDSVVLCPVPAGGDSSKGILSIVAMIAIAIVAPYAAAALNTSMGLGLTAGGIGMAALTAGVAMAGSMLVHSIFAPSQPTAKASDASSSTYGIDGAKNTSLEGIPVPVCYGEFRQAGNVLGMYVDNDGDTQILYMLMSAGEGPIAGISDIYINDNPIADYNSGQTSTYTDSSGKTSTSTATTIETQVRLGLPNQLPIPWFNDTIVAQNKGTKLSTDWIYHTTTTTVDKFRVDVAAPGGLYKINKKNGNSETVHVDMEMQYRASGESAWLNVPTSNEIVGWRGVTAALIVPAGALVNDEGGALYSLDATTGAYVELKPTYTYTYRDTEAPVTDQVTLDYLTNNPSRRFDGFGATTAPTYGGVLRLEAAKRSAVRKSFNTERLTAGVYEIRIRRTAAKSTESNVVDDVYLTDINEIQLESLSYPNTALLGVKIILSDLITGMPNVTFVNGGRKVAVWGKPGAFSTTDQWYDDASKNPAWVVWDILTNRRFGGSMPTSRLDFVAFKNWAAHCDAQGLTWNGVIDSEMNVWDACQLVLRVGHAQVVNVGTRYTVVVEKATSPVMMFSVANMIESSYKETWLSTADRANEIDVSFFDKTDNYKQATIRVYDPVAMKAGHKQRTSAITLYGVVDYKTAHAEGQFQLNLNRYILKTINFSAPLEAVACTVGDLVYVQHDMTDWAVAGRFEAGCTTSLVKLDRDVKMVAGKQYKLLSLLDSVKRAQGSVYNIAGTSLFLTGFSGLSEVKRIQIGGRDLRVVDTFSQGGASMGVIVEDSSGLTVGGAYTLWDTDVIEEYDVVNVGSIGAAITLQSPMTEAPRQFANWMFGEAEKVKKQFRIKSITGSHEYRRDITAIEYNAEVYDHSRYGSGALPTIPPQNAIIGPVRDLEVYEETYVSGPSIVTKVVASWRAPATGMYAGTDIYVKTNDGAMKKAGAAKNVTSFVIDAAKGDTLTVKVVAFDMFDKCGQYELAPEKTYKVIGELSKIDVGEITGADYYWSGRDCKITWRYNATTHSYEFGSEPTGGDAGALDPHFKDYEIRVYDRTHKTLRRTEYVTANSYTYGYDKNFADGIARHLVFEVRMRDIFNNLGSPATLDAYNPPPTVTGSNVTTSFESAQVEYTHSNDPDFAGARIWLARNSSELEGSVETAAMESYLIYQGPDSSVLLSGLMFNADYYFRIAAVDVFGPTELLPTNVLHFKTSHLNVEAIAEGVLKDSQLIPALQDRINLVDGPAAMAGSVAARVLAEATARGTAITTVQNTLTAADSALAARVDSVSTVTGANTAAIVTETNARTTAVSAVSTSLSVVAAKTDANAAAVVSETTARTTADSSLSTRVDSVLAKTNGNIAAISSEISARTTAVSSVASSVNTLQSTLNGNTTAIQTQQGVTNGLSGQYTVKIDSNGYVAGFGLASYPTTSGITSEFIIRADKFAVVIPSYPNVHPFTIGAVNGVPRVIISNALIGDASINNAMIGNAQVNTLSIAGNAVTVPMSVNGYGGVTGVTGSARRSVPGSFISAYFNDTAKVSVLATWQSMAPSNGGNTKLFVNMDGLDYVATADTAPSGGVTSHVASGVFAVSAGTHTFSLIVTNEWSSGSWDLGAWSLTVLGVKR